MIVYVLHFTEPYKHAKHYVGIAEDLENRLNEHRRGIGARLTQVIADAGIGFVLARTWKDKDKSFERRIKNWHGASRFCPICDPDNAMHRLIDE